MKKMPRECVFHIVVIASHGDSLVTFRGDLLRRMRAQNKRVLALAPELSKETRDWMQTEDIACREAPLSRTGTDPFSDLRLLLWLRAELRAARPEVVLAYTVKPVVYGMLAARTIRARRYALITGLGYAFTDGEGGRRLMRGLLEVLYRLALAQANKVFFQNGDDEALFRRRKLLATDTPSVVFAGSGVDVSSYSYVEPPPGPISFLLIARFLGDKGLREYVAAIRILRQSYPAVVGRIAGWIDTNPDAIDESELRDWVAEGVIENLGRLKDVRAALRDCTVYVLPSYREGTPRTVLEAMATGRAIVTTDAPGCRETVVEGENGFLVPVRDAMALASTLARFVTDPELAVKMGRKSRMLAESKYDVRKVTHSMLVAMELVDDEARL